MTEHEAVKQSAELLRKIIRSIDKKLEYNFLDPKWEWYERPKRERQAIWTEPYFDDGGGNTIMITYSAPYRRDDLFWGFATIDIAMRIAVVMACRIDDLIV